MAGGVFSGAKLNAMTIRESANDGSDFTNPDADYRRLFLGEDGLLHVRDSAGSVTSPYAAATAPYVGCKAYADGTQSISDATSTAVAFNQEEFDTDTFHDNATNNSRFTVPSGKGGKYRLTGGVNIATSASPVIAQLWWRLNGTTSIRAGITWIPNAGAQTGGVVVNDVSLVATDYVELMFYQDSSGSRNIGHASALESQSFGAVSLIGT